MWPFAKPVSYLGVDIGSNGIKVVELQKKGKHSFLYTYGFSDKNLLSENDNNGFLDIDSTAELLKNICLKAKTTSRLALASLPASTVYSALLNIPVLKVDEKKAFITRQIEKLIPIPLSDVIVDYKDVRRTKAKIEDKFKTQAEDVFFTAAPKKIIASYTEIFKKAGLTLLSLETESLALIASLIGKDISPILIIDMGAAQTDFMLVENGIPVLFHTLKFGGKSFTQALQKVLGLTEAEAEQSKRDLKNEASFPAIFNEPLSPIVEAIRYIFELYAKQKNDTASRPEKIILTGGSSLLPHLDTKLGDLFNIKVYLGDPWARVVYAEELKPVLDAIGPRCATSLGLALKKIEG
ncbi:MAG: pilus assembly protein PilM [Candidatus Magasanikbacteria bacterium]|nr:pilus assembly protein PilM [Candidatus Magasanikbacteria bacterium]